MTPWRPLTLMKRPTFPSLLASRKFTSFIALFKLFVLSGSVLVPFTRGSTASASVLAFLSWAGVWFPDAPAEGEWGCGPPVDTA